MRTNVVTKKANELNFNFEGLNNLPAKKQVSELSQLNQSINRTVEGNVRGLSSYFKEFRKKGSELSAKMKLYNAKGRTFDSDLCHKIINCGEILHITKGSDRYENEKRAKAISQGKEHKDWNGVWSADRLQKIFFFVVETTPAKK